MLQICGCKNDRRVKKRSALTTKQSSPVKPFRDEASKFGALWGYRPKRKFRSGHELKKKKKKKKEKEKTTKRHAKTHTVL